MTRKHTQIYRPDLCEKLIEHMTEGNTFESFTKIAGCRLCTLRTWADKFPEFKEAIEEAESAYLAYHDKIIIDKVKGRK